MYDNKFYMEFNYIKTNKLLKTSISNFICDTEVFS